MSNVIMVYGDTIEYVQREIATKTSGRVVTSIQIVNDGKRFGAFVVYDPDKVYRYHAAFVPTPV